MSMFRRDPAALRRGQILNTAIDTLYRRRGGLSLDLQIAMYDAAIEIALFCRTSDLERAKKGVVNREKGERPLVSVTEGRLYCNKSIQLFARREELKARLRAEIMEQVDAAQPKSVEEFEAAVNAALGGEAIAAKETAAAEAQASAEVEALEKEVGPIVTLLGQVLNIGERKELMAAMEQHDESEIARIVKMQPEKWQRKWSEARAALVQR